MRVMRIDCFFSEFSLRNCGSGETQDSRRVEQNFLAGIIPKTFFSGDYVKFKVSSDVGGRRVTEFN